MPSAPPSKPARRCSRAFLVFSLVGAAPLAALQPRAASSLAKDCDGATVSKLLPGDLDATWRDHRPIDVWLRQQPLRAAGRWGEVGREIRREYQRVAQALDAEAARTIDVQLDALQAELDSVEAVPEYRANRGPDISRFQLDASDDGTSYKLFGRNPVARALVISDTQPGDARRAVCWTAIIASRAATSAGDKARANLVNALEVRVKRWDNFRENGLSMFPFELVANGWCGSFCRETGDPPTNQIVAAHAFAAEEVAASTWTNLTSRNAIVLEPLGLIHYRQDRNWYLGGGLVVSIPSGAAAGLGGIVHVGRVGSFGYVARASTPASNAKGSFFVTMDLYRYLKIVPGQFQAERDRLQAQLQRCRGDDSAASCKTQ